MGNRAMRAVLAAALTAALAVTVGPTTAHAEAAAKAPVPKPISPVLSRSPQNPVSGPAAIRNYKSKLYLEPNGIAVGAPILQQAQFRTDRQGWYVGLTNDGLANFIQNAGVVLNIGTAGGGTASNTSVVLVRPSSSLDQQWQPDYLDNTNFRLKNRKDPSKCMGVDGASTNAGARVAIYDCGAGRTPDNQAWFIDVAP